MAKATLHIARFSDKASRSRSLATAIRALSYQRFLICQQWSRSYVVVLNRSRCQLSGYQDIFSTVERHPGSVSEPCWASGIIDHRRATAICRRMQLTIKRWSHSRPMSVTLLYRTYRKQALNLLLIAMWSIWSDVCCRLIETQLTWRHEIILEKTLAKLKDQSNSEAYEWRFANPRMFIFLFWILHAPTHRGPRINLNVLSF